MCDLFGNSKEIMKTPIFDFIEKYNDKNSIRLHMPGHKGISKLGPEAIDITEVNGADVLYHSNGIIKESQGNASRIFSTAKTLYSTEGSSLCIRAMLFLIKQYAISKNKKPLILAGRNAHKTFVTASALLDIDVSWLYSSQENFLSCEIDLHCLEKELRKKKPTALYITNPDYLGNILDIQSISKLCKKYNTLLLVDNAHGSYLKFLENSLHPIDLGADMCCDSAHKTLPVLTGGAYLHISENTPLLLKENADNAMSMFASTSPSYLILQSLDLFNKSVTNDFKDKISHISDCVKELKETLASKGFKLVGDEPLKITIATKSYGYYGYELANLLEKQNIVAEYYDNDFLVLMFSADTKTNDVEKIFEVIDNIKKLDSISSKPPELNQLKEKIKPSKAITMQCEYVKTLDAVGRILASPCVSCPPAVCVAVCGEKLDKTSVDMFLYYGIEEVLVIKKKPS